MNLLPVLQTGKLIVLCGADSARAESMTLIAELGLRGPVTILDGGNRYQPRRVALLLGRKTADIRTAVNRLFGRRAFTCYEMNTLLGSTPSLSYPCVILDLLNTFYDDHVPIHEAERLLKSCLEQIRRLQLSAPVVVTLAPPLAIERALLVERVCDRADHLLHIAPSVSSVSQLPLFP